MDWHWRAPQGRQRNPEGAQEAESPKDRFSDPSRHGGLRTREAVHPVPSKPRAVALCSGHLGPACSPTSRGSRKLRETILAAQGELGVGRPLGSPPPCSQKQGKLLAGSAKQFRLMAVVHRECQLSRGTGTLPPPFPNRKKIKRPTPARQAPRWPPPANTLGQAWPEMAVWACCKGSHGLRTLRGGGALCGGGLHGPQRLFHLTALRHWALCLGQPLKALPLLPGQLGLPACRPP